MSRKRQQLGTRVEHGRRYPRPPRQRCRRRRSGIVVSLMLVGCLLLAALAALAIYLSLLVCQHRQLLVACESGALAGAAELFMAPRPIEVATPQPTLTLASWPIERNRRNPFAKVRREASRFASANYVAGEPYSLNLNLSNHTQGDIVIGRVEKTGQLGAAMDVNAVGAAPNSVLVRAGAHYRRGNRFTKLIGSCFGLPEVTIPAQARATVDQQLVGFQPAGRVRVPVVPIVLQLTAKARTGEDGSASARSALQEEQTSTELPETIRPHWGDSSQWRFHIGTVGEEGSEKTVNGTRPAHVWRLPDTPIHLDRLLGQIEHGFGRGDLASVSGQLTLGALAGMKLVDQDSWADGITSRQLGEALQHIVGQRRVWVARHQSASAEAAHQSVFYEFVGGRLTTCRVDPNRGVLIEIEPCRLTTPTALVQLGAMENRWIGKLMLTL